MAAIKKFQFITSPRHLTATDSRDGYVILRVFPSWEFALVRCRKMELASESGETHFLIPVGLWLMFLFLRD